jgi:hypothetical protein
VQGDRVPHDADRVGRDAPPAQELARGVRAVDLEAVVCAAMTLDEADVVEDRADVEQLGVVLEAMPLTVQRAKDIDAHRVVKEEIRLDVPDQLRRLVGQRAVRNGDPGDRGSYGHAPSVRAGREVRKDASSSDRDDR